MHYDNIVSFQLYIKQDKQVTMTYNNSEYHLKQKLLTNYLSAYNKSHLEGGTKECSK